MQPAEITIRAANTGDAAAIVAIYNHYITNTAVSFETEEIDAPQMQNRISEVLQANLPYLVAEDSNGNITGYAYATKWRARFAYRFSVEISVYLAPGATGAGIGSMLYRQLFSQLKQRGIHAVIAGIALPNDASIALHKKFAMTQVAEFKQVGFKFNQWLDVGYWQVLL
ncbi:arsinothricin resistance N-acetyltransferase ArsN1 family B [Rheinheimera oceanensis]|uniref:arsinothricin resistance N-acetyltransferase ArsN1 family B n=1 Tax=Rheinheimera oceanensis TaxID=2817449 RepID=UPI001BFDADDE|nr:arsinothricin resistance N-acetyltransferase ArsN1 family B [Rheinheimera oceanensis]